MRSRLFLAASAVALFIGPGATAARGQEGQPAGDMQAAAEQARNGAQGPATPQIAPAPAAPEAPPEQPLEPCPARPEDEEQARKVAGEWFARGEALYNREHNRQALEAFLCSLELVEHPATLFNAAQAARSAREYERAYELLKRYRELVPQSDVSDVVSVQLAELEELLAGLERSVGEKEEVSGEGREERSRAAEPQESPEPVGGGGSRLAVPGYVSLGVGGALIVAGAVTGGMALSLNGELVDECAGGECPASKRDDLDRRDTLAVATNVLVVLGIASATAGVLMLTVFSGGGGEEQALAVRAVLGPGFAGASAGGRF